MNERQETSEDLERATRLSFEALVLPHLGRLHGTALRLTRRPEEASDLVQETMLRAYRTFANFAPGTNEKAWLFTIMYSIFVNAYRRERREPDLVAADELENRFQQTIELPDGSAHLEILRNPALEWHPSEAERALQRLPEEFRIAVLLVDVQDLSYEEAAGAMKCPVGTLRSRLFRARKQLAVELLDYARNLGYVKE
jgi:RNA polymerase sigma-70 factor (ECF subfamily)